MERGAASTTAHQSPQVWSAGAAVRVLLLAVVAALGFLLVATPAAAARQDPTAPVELVLFWGDGCPHCEALRAWLPDLRADYPDLVVTQHEVWYDEANQRLFAETMREHGLEASGVPTVVVGEKVWVGWSDAIGAEIRAEVAAQTAAARTGAGAGAGAGAGTGDGAGAEPTTQAQTTVDVPLLGEVDLAGRPLAVSTVVIGFVDGVNPCSLWVISVLLAIVVRTGSRARVLLIGSAFLTVTALMYALYMAGIYSAMSVVRHLDALQVVVAVVAGVFGIVSVKDYFAFKKGLSFTIPDSAKPGMYRRMRDAAGQHSLLGALGATVVLAAGVSLLETPCTAGFPVLWTGMLADQGVGAAGAAGLFVLYMLPFLVDELVVFGVAVVTLRSVKLQERHGQLLKLVAGTTMLALAATMLWSPATMTEPLGALAVFAVALAAALLVHLATVALRRTASHPLTTRRPRP